MHYPLSYPGLPWRAREGRLKDAKRVQITMLMEHRHGVGFYRPSSSVPSRRLEVGPEFYQYNFLRGTLGVAEYRITAKNSANIAIPQKKKMENTEACIARGFVYARAKEAKTSAGNVKTMARLKLVVETFKF